MWVWVDRLGGLLLDVGLAAVGLWSVVALAMLGSRQPARRLRMARAAAVGSLALWPLIGLGLVPRVDVVALLHSFGVLPHPLVPEWWASRAPSEPGAAVVWGVRAVAVAYAAGVAAGLGWLALGWVALHWLTAGSAAPAAETRALYDDMPFPPGRRRPRLRVASRARRPVLVGVVRPLILIPPELERPEARGRLRLSLLHELAHAEAGDARHGLLIGLARAAWFFAPPFRWAMAQIRVDQEVLADRRAAAGFGPPREYASALLDFASARAAATGPGLASGGGGSGAGSPLFQRVQMLLRCPFPVEPGPPAWWVWGLAGLTAAGTLGVAALSVRPTAAPAAVTPPPVHAFRVATLETRPSTPGPTGRAPLFELPVRLPERFELRLEVWGNPASLAETRVTGLPLGTAVRPVPPAPDGWHPVRVLRDRDGVRLWVDGRALPLGRPDPALTAWLSVEPPPEQAGRFRRLVLTWSS